MNVSDMAHRVTDVVKRLADRLMFRRDSHADRPSGKDRSSDPNR